ncbi:MAG TPA: hypothetical protein VGP46_07930 [Acidimicrobiales bacterium]|nr:hypothetical protein [Acidimicrobiales bacterium]
MQVATNISVGLVALDRGSVGVRPGVTADTRNLPGDLLTSLASRYREATLLELV